MKNDIIYLKNVEFTELKRYSRSYGAPVKNSAKLATIEGDFLITHSFVPAGEFTEKYNMRAKYFVSLDSYTEIKESTFKSWCKKLKKEALGRKAKIEAERIEQVNDQKKRIEAAKAKVLARKQWLCIYLAKRNLELSDLNRHKVANLYGFKLANRFNCKPSDLRSAFKQLF